MRLRGLMTKYIRVGLRKPVTALNCALCIRYVFWAMGRLSGRGPTKKLGCSANLPLRRLQSPSDGRSANCYPLCYPQGKGGPMAAYKSLF